MLRDKGIEDLKGKVNKTKQLLIDMEIKDHSPN